MADLRIGVIGVDGRGKLARNAHKPNEGSVIVGGADVFDESLEKFQNWANGKGINNLFVTKDYHELLANPAIDAVFITSPDWLHEEHALAALKAGKHVYLEKPMAISIEGCDKILNMAKETGSKLFLGHNMRHMTDIIKMKEILDSGVIGEIQAVWARHHIPYGGDAYFKDWHSEREFSTGLLLQKAAHDIDVIHWLAGSYGKTVVGMGKLSVYDKCERRGEDEKGNSGWSSSQWPPLEQKKMSPKIDVEDHSMIMFQLNNGVQCSYVQCHYSPDSMRNFTFIGTKGRIENIGLKVSTQVKADNINSFCNSEIQVYTQRAGAELGPDITYKVKGVSGGHGGSDPKIVKEFIDFIKEGIQTNTSPVAARNSVAVGCLATESLRGDGGLKIIPDLNPELISYFDNNQR
ncbi:MAG: oxidoreductase [Planctomycetota bacterium]|nr:MAG: oxidoreductase [Planctomycetota bacterium]